VKDDGKQVEDKVPQVDNKGKQVDYKKESMDHGQRINSMSNPPTAIKLVVAQKN